jgi:hypothetical protein
MCVRSSVSLGPRRCRFICLLYLQFFENTIFPFLASTAELIGDQFYNRQCATNSSMDRESSCLYDIHGYSMPDGGLSSCFNGLAGN